MLAQVCLENAHTPGHPLGLSELSKVLFPKVCYCPNCSLKLLFNLLLASAFIHLVRQNYHTCLYMRSSHTPWVAALALGLFCLGKIKAILLSQSSREPPDETNNYNSLKIKSTMFFLIPLPEMQPVTSKVTTELRSWEGDYEKLKCHKVAAVILFSSNIQLLFLSNYSYGCCTLLVSFQSSKSLILTEFCQVFHFSYCFHGWVGSWSFLLCHFNCFPSL